MKFGFFVHYRHIHIMFFCCSARILHGILTEKPFQAS